MAKEFVGLEKFDVDSDHYRPWVQALSHQVLQALMQGIPPQLQMALGGVHCDASWEEGKGLHFNFTLQVGGVPAISLEHTLAVDARDAKHSELVSRLAAKHHQARQA